MKVSFYIPSLHLGKILISDFINGNIGLSGTDAQILNRAVRLFDSGLDVVIYTNNVNLVSDKIKIRYSSSLKEAVSTSKFNSEIIVFNNRGNKETLDGIKACEQEKVFCIVWDQNGPSGRIEDLLADCKYVKRLVCVSKSQLDYTRDHPVFYKGTFIYNSIDTSLYYSGKKIKDSICYLGSLTPSKGFHHLAKVWKKIKEECPEARLTVIGSGKLYNRNQQLDELGIAEKEYEKNCIVPYLGANMKEINSLGVNFAGLMSPNEIRKILSETEVGIVNPNLKGSTETFCVSAVEMQAAGCPVIGANRNGLRETVMNNKTGFLINREADLIKKVITLLKNKSLRVQMSEKAKLHTASFDEKLVNQKWLTLLKEVKANKPVITIPFSFKRATSKILIRELIRYLKRLPFVAQKVPPLSRFRRNST